MMTYKVEKDTRNLAILRFAELELNIDECQFLYDDGYRPIMAYSVQNGMEVLCEKVDIYGVRGLQ